MISLIEVGEDQIKDLFVGDMGIKSAAIGDETIYTRPGGYIYLELVLEEE